MPGDPDGVFCPSSDSLWRAASFDQIVGADLQYRRHLDAERLDRLQVADQLVAGRSVSATVGFSQRRFPGPAFRVVERRLPDRPARSRLELPLFLLRSQHLETLCLEQLPRSRRVTYMAHFLIHRTLWCRSD